MAKTGWEDLHQRIMFRDRRSPVRKPTRDDCQHAEHALKIKLPTSYISFITLFGAGELAHEFQIFAPACSNQEFDLLTVNHRSKDVLENDGFVQAYSDDPSQTLRLVVFARNFSGDYFGFDPTQPTTKDGAEYKIFLRPRLLGANEYYTETFEGFIRELCLGDLYLRYRKVESWDLDGDRFSFEPAGQ